VKRLINKLSFCDKMELKKDDLKVIREELMPKMELKIESPKLDKVDYGFKISNDLEFMRPEIKISNMFDEIKSDWKEVEQFSFKNMDIDKTFKNMLRRI